MNALERGYRRFFGAVFTPIARGLLAIGVTPNMVTVAGTCVASAAALWLFPTGHLFAGSLVIGATVFTDTLDGTMARRRGGHSRFGEFLDSTLDRIADGAIFAGLAIWAFGMGGDPLTGYLALACLVMAFVISYARAKAEAIGLSGKAGIAERGVRLFVTLLSALLVGCGLDARILPIGLGLLAAACLQTVIARLVTVAREAKAAESAEVAATAKEAEA